MSTELKADDLIPLRSKLSVAERLRLFNLVLKQGMDDAQAYAAEPPHEAEFSSEDDLLSWDADGWEDIIWLRP